ncbi:hypothetical protein W97_09120 [Coniosporium apollinis CBS 100218]|uniref:Uncharacterized protein n=1 Tax=Coniosporium apollinis (strain CBS 100218) TaxID=1168221 RepID=R7Z6Q7_CONA1|nr:uncharacterized protein W97_09120 [Coniosporium apollinis CBS 100218]EON69857.1 hypothetical protein W97_09120 [Coniosporium apollinis CBS 100218]
MDFVNFLSGPVQAASDSLRGAIIEGAREGFSLVQQHLSAGVTKTFDEGAGIIQQGLKQTFDEGARTIQEGLNDALKQTFKDGACTIQQGVQQGFRQAFDKGLTDARGYIKKKDDLATVFKDFLECYLKAEAKDRAVRWWQSFLPLVITVAVFGGSITFTLIIQEIADPVELNAKFSSETVRTFISLAWLLFLKTALRGKPGLSPQFSTYFLSYCMHPY